MSDFLIMFLLYSCLSSVGCWSIKWRMRLKGGLSLHKQSSRVPGKSSFLTLISLGKYITKTQCGISRCHMSYLLSELKQIPALGWPGRTGVPWSLAVIRAWHRFEPCCAQRGPSLAQLRVPEQAEPCSGLAAGPGHGAAAAWGHLESHRNVQGPRLGHPLGPHLPTWRGRAGVRNCPAACPWQNHSGFTTGCSRMFLYPGGSFGTA